MQDDFQAEEISVDFKKGIVDIVENYNIFFAYMNLL